MSSDEIRLVSDKRTEFGKGAARKLRRADKVPAVLYGHGEAAFIEGIRMINPLDVLDCILLHKRDNAVIIDTWTV